MDPQSVGVAVVGASAAFLATPAEVSEDLAPPLLERGLTVIDISGAFRLDAQAVYGLPELFGDQLPGARLVANPGCYPTSILLPLKPLVLAGLLDLEAGLVADSISGASGAGRGSSAELQFCEVSARAYGVFTHRHAPEIDHWLGAKVVFVPHLAPFERGILSTIHARLREGTTEADLRGALDRWYGSARFVRLLPPGAWPAVKDVVGTNFCDLALAVAPDGRRAVLVSALDNLLKGAAGQAVQNLNRVFGLEEGLGL